MSGKSKAFSFRGQSAFQPIGRRVILDYSKGLSSRLDLPFDSRKFSWSKQPD
ncbi:MAG: hypothetical protein JWP57_1448 [Spirosoma sp.]|nr:hypothetical protein [Spirosoma sp.]